MGVCEKIAPVQKWAQLVYQMDLCKGVPGHNRRLLLEQEV